MRQDRRLKILIYSLNYAPELTGVGKYSGEMAEWLAGRGHKVRVVCGPPYYPQWRVAEGYRSWWYARERRNGVGLWRCPVWVPRRASGVKRLVHLFSFVLSSTPALLRHVFWSPDVIIATEPPFMGAPSVLLAARLARAKSWLHVQDLEVDAAFALGLLRKGWMSRLAFGLERRIKAAFDRISTISEAMADRIRGKLGVEDGIVTFPNWVDTGAIRPLNRPSDLRAELGIEKDAVVALYSGNMGKKQGLELIVDAARRLHAQRNLVFVFCGDGSSAKELRKQTAALDNVRWLPLQPFERLNELLTLADVHLLPQRQDAADLVMPSKLTGIMASGRPVVATAREGTELACAVGDAGRITAPGDAATFIEAICSLVEDNELRARMGTIARSYAERFWEKERVLGDFEDALYRLVPSSGSQTGAKGSV